MIYKALHMQLKLRCSGRQQFLLH